MTDEQRDRAWQSLPEDFKKEVREMYQSFKREMIESRDISSLSSTTGKQIVLDEIFGTRNLTAGEQPKPRFKVGDKVRIKAGICVNPAYVGKIGTIRHISEMKYITLEEIDSVWEADCLAPYAAPEAKEEEEAKELNLCELLQGCEGMEFYSKIFGKCILDSTTAEYHKNKPIRIKSTDGITVWLRPDGKMHEGGELMLFPSAEVRTWEGWQKPLKRWKPKEGGRIYSFEIGYDELCGCSYDSDARPARLHEFRTKGQAEEAAKRVREVLNQIHDEYGE